MKPSARTQERDLKDAQRLGVHPDSLPAYRAIVNRLSNPHHTDTKENIAYCENLISCAHTDDTQRLNRLLWKLRMEAGDFQAPAAPDVQPRSVMRLTDQHIKIDPHMFRAASCSRRVSDGLCETSLLRLYFIARHIDSQRPAQAGRGWVSIAELKAFTRRAEIFKKSSFWRWIHQGNEAGYWHYTADYERIHYAGLQVVARHLTEGLSDEDLPEFRGNQALGGRMVWIDCRGNLQAFRGKVLGAWLEQRAPADGRGVIIQIPIIARMWRTSARAVFDWRQAANIPFEENYSWAPDEVIEEGKLPEQRKPNTYHAPADARKHHASGNSSKARRASYAVMESRGVSPDTQNSPVGQTSVVKCFHYPGKHTPALERGAKHLARHPEAASIPQHAYRRRVNLPGRVVNLFIRFGVD